MSCLCRVFFIILLTGYTFTHTNFTALECGRNEEICWKTECSTDNMCPTSEKQGTACSKPESFPTQTCKCQFNYRRALNRTCIPITDCPAFDCPQPHEEYNACPPLCPTDDCSQATPNGECPLFGFIGVVLECQPGCRCIKNYWRKNKICVPYEQCFK